MIFILRLAKPLMVTLTLAITMLSISLAPMQEVVYSEVEMETKEVENTVQDTQVKTEEVKVMQDEITPKEVDTRKKYERVESTSRGQRQEVSTEDVIINFLTPCAGKKSQGYHSGHRAVDIYNKYGTEIYASADGICVKKVHSNAGYGNHVIIEHEGGYKTLYAHCSKLIVDIDQNVKAGDLIGYMGSTGRSTGNHLHFEIYKNGVQQNPLKYISLI